MSENLRVWSDIGYAATIMERGTHAISFMIYSQWSIRDDGEPSFDEDWDIEGGVKWDGCSNWRTPGHGYSVHCCGRDQFEKLAEAMRRCWDWTAEILPTFDCPISR